MLCISFLFTCIACVGHGRRVHSLAAHFQRRERSESHTPRKVAHTLSQSVAETLRASDIFDLRRGLSIFLLALKPTSAFNPSTRGVHLDLGKPRSTSSCSFLQHLRHRHSLCVLGINKNVYLERFGDLMLPPAAVNPITVEEGCEPFVVDSCLPGNHILDTSLVDDQSNPLLCFVNPTAGGGQARQVMNMLKDFVHPSQIVDVMESGTEIPLREFANKLNRYRILVCGGDGTAAEVLSHVQKVHSEMNRSSNIPGVAILPIGTGNDLAAALGWGRGFRFRRQIPMFLEKIKRSQSVPIDRWDLCVNDASSGDRSCRVFQNYLGVGIDANIAVQCANLREKMPYLFFNRWLNRKYYGLAGIRDFFRNYGRDFCKQVKIQIDGQEVILPPRTKGIVVLNTKSYGGGSQVWWDDELDKFKPASISDGLFEVIAIRGPVQLGGIKSGLSRPQKIAQGSSMTIETNVIMPIQVDGEPWMQDICTLSMQIAQQSARMLYPDEPFKGMRQSIKDFLY